MKKTAKKLTALLIAVILCLSMTVVASAAEVAVGNAIQYDPNFDWYGVTLTVNGKTAFCLEPSYDIQSGSYGNITESTNTNLLKALYYGYNGPGWSNGKVKAAMDKAKTDHLLGASGNNLYYLLTHRAASYLYGSDLWNAPQIPMDWQKATLEVADAIKNQPAVNGYVAYLVHTGNKSQTIGYLSQKKIVLQLKKNSANAQMTNGNNCYSLAGAVYGIYARHDATGLIGKVTTNKLGYALFDTPVPQGKYFTREITPSPGYARDLTIYEFKATGNNSQDGLPVYFTNVYEKPKNDPVGMVVKKESGEGKALAGAEFTINYYSGYYTDESVKDVTPTRSWVVKTDNDGEAYLLPEYIVNGNNFYATSSGTPCIPLGTVTIQETKAPDGYQIDNTIHLFQITDEGSAMDSEFVQTFNMPTIVNDSNKLFLEKRDRTNKFLSGATVQLLDSNKAVIEEWVTTTSPYSIDPDKLVVGETYTYHEVSAPAGYVRAKDISFVYEGITDKTVTMIDALTETYISKTDITGQNEIEGAKMSLADKSGKVIETWTSGTSAHLIKGLVAGEKYVLTETIAPDGYVVTTPITFTVKTDGSPTYVQMKNDYTKTVVSKKSITGDDELPNAHLKVVDENGKIIDEWVSGNKPHEIKGLTGGKTYKLIETISPDGYTIAEEITFTVKTDGTTTNVEMRDAPTVTVVSKKAVASMDELPGAVLRVVDENGKVVDEWTSTNKPHEIQGLTRGKTYKLIETTSPNGYTIAEEVAFTVNMDGSTTHVEMLNQPTETEVSKKDITGDNELPGAGLKVVDKDGNVIDEWVSGEKPHNIKGLTRGETYTLIETISPDGYTIANSVDFTVNMDGTTTFVEMKDDVTRYQFDKVDENKKPIKGAKLQLLDESGNIVDEWTTDGTAHVVVGKLIVGKKYTLREVAAPEGYEKAEDYIFEVGNTSELQTVTMVDKYEGAVKISTPDQPVTPSSSQNGNGFVQTGEQFPFVIVTLILASAIAIVFLRKRQTN